MTQEEGALCCNYCGVWRPQRDFRRGHPTGSCRFLCRGCEGRVTAVRVDDLLLDHLLGDAGRRAAKATYQHGPPYGLGESNLVPAARKWAGRPYEMRTRRKFLALAGLPEAKVLGQMMINGWAFNSLITARPEDWMPIRVKREDGRLYLIDGEHRATLALALGEETIKAVIM